MLDIRAIVGVAMKSSVLVSVFAFFLLLPLSAALAGYSSLIVFGDSLSDSGNNAIVLPGVTPVPIPPPGVPPPANSFVPDFPYASGRYTNDQVWAQILATSLGLSANPSLTPQGTDYAFGGATTGPLTPNPFHGGLLNPFPPSLETQVAFFLSQRGPAIPGNALYVVEGGGQNARNALTAVASCGGDSVCISGIIQSTTAGYVGDISTIDSELEGAGAKNILVWDVPNIGATPAALAAGAEASAVGTLIANTMNRALSAAIGSDPDITLFDIFDLMNAAIANPGAFGLTNVTDACAQFSACIADPSNFLFWDGIHPTSATEDIISDAIEALVVPEPSSLALLVIAFLGSASSASPASRVFEHCASGSDNHSRYWVRLQLKA
jgi:outer membrane lipase/esterase